MSRPHPLSIALALMLLLPTQAWAIVNPSLQPDGILERYLVVLLLRVDAVDDAQHSATLSVTQVIKGEYAAKEVRIALGESSLTPGEQVLAYVGGKGRASARNILLYPGGGRWKSAQIQEDTDPLHPQWTWTADLSRVEMGGTFNGRVDRLAEMMVDAASGRYFFPAVPVAQFRTDLVVDHLAGPVDGVAIYDLNGDGRPDLYACSEGGDRVYLQTAPMVFTESRKALGLDGLASSSISVADVDADGRPDLLVDGRIFLQQANGNFAASSLLPASANAQVKCAAFVEMNGDGYADVVIARLDGGLHVYLNPSKAGGAFSDATERLGLDREDLGATKTGFFCAGDWDGDGHTDLFFAVGKGLLLLQDTKGGLAMRVITLRHDFKTGGEAQGLTGSGCFAPLWTPGGNDLVFSTDANEKLVVSDGGTPRDFSTYGNEIEEGSDAQLTTVAEDLDMDGNVDVYCASREDNMHMLYCNRGYGSFTVPTKYRKGDEAVFLGEATRRAAWGVAVGDVDGDGANDLLMGMRDGAVALVMNDVLAKRFTKEQPKWHEKKLQGTTILSVTVTGRIGVVGAAVILSDGNGTVVGRRVLGANIGTGGCGPNTVNLAVRETAGAHTLTVIFSDGTKQTWPVELSGTERHLSLTASRKP